MSTRKLLLLYILHSGCPPGAAPMPGGALCHAYNNRVSFCRRIGYARFYHTMSELCEDGLVHPSDKASVVDGEPIRCRTFELTEAGRALL